MSKPAVAPLRFWRKRTAYSCGNCRETFKTQDLLWAHQPCPLYFIEKEVAEHNRAAYRLIQSRKRGR